jgi:hypothetical protein
MGNDLGLRNSAGHKIVTGISLLITANCYLLPFLVTITLALESTSNM